MPPDLKNKLSKLRPTASVDEIATVFIEYHSPDDGGTGAATLSDAVRFVREGFATPSASFATSTASKSLKRLARRTRTPTLSKSLRRALVQHACVECGCSLPPGKEGRKCKECRG